MVKNSIPLVTIVTSTYNHERFLKQAIDSVLSQDYPRIEYIVIDDGSTDNTKQILKNYDNRLYWESQRNMGETPTLNKAIKRAKGELIGKLSSDDFLYPGAIGSMVNMFLEKPGLIAVYTDFDLVDENGEVFATVKKPEYNYLDSIRKHLCLPGPGTLFKKDIFDLVGGFDTSFSILFDLDFWWHAGLYGQFARLPVSLSAFRQHKKSQSFSGGKKMAEETIKCINKLYSRSDLPKDVKKIKREAYSSAYYSAAMQSITGGEVEKTSKRYLLQSFLFSPANYFKKENHAKAVNWIKIILPSKLRLILKWFNRIMGNKK